MENIDDSKDKSADGLVEDHMNLKTAQNVKIDINNIENESVINQNKKIEKGKTLFLNLFYQMNYQYHYFQQKWKFKLILKKFCNFQCFLFH